jgi:glycyl-tRNA synthetase beta chain
MEKTECSDLLIEIGTEEIPSRFFPGALKEFEDIVREGLERLRLSHGESRYWGTPRRLTVMVEGVSLLQRDVEEEVLGPPKSVAYDKDGNPTEAALGFARKQGLDVSKLRIAATPKGEYVAAVRKIKGRDAMEVLKEEIPRWILSIPFPKSMRWADSEIRFVRPIHWIVAILGEEVIRFSVDSIVSGRKTRGHRFLHPQELEIPLPRDYIEVCRRGCVIADPDERRRVIQQEAKKAAAELSGRLVEDEALLNELVYLTEYPVIIYGSFDPGFLDLPREVLVTAMKEQQKFFCVEDQDGRLLHSFIGVANLNTDNMDLIRKGNERVLHARLSDARFFFNEDLKRTLQERVEDLKGVIFHSKLGTLFEKTLRIREIATRLARRLNGECVELVERAAWLCKADLTTEMVGEFPSLQGVMGKHYALIQGEDPRVATAIEEHYLPAYSGDRLPSSDVGALVSVSDKLDTIVGCFAVGEVPTGAGDPYGLRRAALGIIHILLERGYPFSLDFLIELAIETLGEQDNLKTDSPLENLKGDIGEFFRVRLANLWQAQGHEQDVVEAVLAVGFQELPETLRKVQALEEFRKEEGFEDLALAYKRVANIVRDAPEGEVDRELFEHPQEDALFKGILRLRDKMDGPEARQNPILGLRALAEVRPLVDEFFDAVLVNTEDHRLRENRLHLLATLRGLFLRIADLSKIQTRA